MTVELFTEQRKGGRYRVKKTTDDNYTIRENINCVHIISSTVDLPALIEQQIVLQ